MTSRIEYKLYDSHIAVQKQAMIAEKNNSNRPKYYQLKDGWAASFAAFCKKPQEQLDYYKDNRPRFLLEHIGVVALKLPALFGKCISSLIHFVKGEKIKRADYDTYYQEWMQKDYNIRSTCNIKKFIDFCIKNKIHASQCPYQVIIDHRNNSNATFHMFTGDGRVGDYDREIRQKRINVLILTIPQEKASEKFGNSGAKMLKTYWASHIATHEKTGTEEGDRERSRTVKEYCQFARFSTRVAALNKHLIADITQRPQP